METHMSRVDAPIVAPFLTGHRMYDEEGNPTGVYITEDQFRRMVAPSVLRRIDGTPKRDRTDGV